ncbi:transcription factor ATOH8 [Candoia aspera]|uniref:transcription factor ATOH8 n=1 Tax=Candoia aspera TaxID=51853 RepID=UPI002FD813F7
MKNLQLVEAEARWQRFCLKELRGIQKLKRRSRQGLRGGGGGQLPVPEHVRAGRPGGARPESLPEGGREGLAGAELPFPPLRCRGPLFPGQQSLPSRAAAGQLAPPRARESPLAPPPSRALYGGSPEPSASPRKRPGEAAGAATEIKALQQTRRLLANARERTRVHTISAAFEALRKQVPCYSYGQKLSKLAILRIACNYILSLARLADLDYSADHSNMSFSECVEQCTRTLQAEGRSKKRKE